MSTRGSVALFGASFLVAVLLGLAAGTFPWSGSRESAPHGRNDVPESLETDEGPGTTRAGPREGGAGREGGTGSDGSERSAGRAGVGRSDDEPRTLADALMARRGAGGGASLLGFGSGRLGGTSGTAPSAPAAAPPPPGSSGGPAPPPAPRPPPPPPGSSPAPADPLPTPPPPPSEPAPPPTAAPAPPPAVHPPGATAPPRLDPDHPSNRRGDRPSDRDD